MVSLLWFDPLTRTQALPTHSWWRLILDRTTESGRVKAFDIGNSLNEGHFQVPEMVRHNCGTLMKRTLNGTPGS